MVHICSFYVTLVSYKIYSTFIFITAHDVDDDDVKMYVSGFLLRIHFSMFVLCEFVYVAVQ